MASGISASVSFDDRPEDLTTRVELYELPLPGDLVTFGPGLSGRVRQRVFHIDGSVVLELRALAPRRREGAADGWTDERIQELRDAGWVPAEG